MFCVDNFAFKLELYSIKSLLNRILYCYLLLTKLAVVEMIPNLPNSKNISIEI